MKINKLTESKSFEDVKLFFEERKLTKGNIRQKITYFQENNIEGRYDWLLTHLKTLCEQYPNKEKITSEKAKEYLEQYGATKAVEVLLEEGISITRQGLYKAIKDKK